MANNIITDYIAAVGDFTVAVPISEPIFSTPFQGDAGDYLLEQEYCQDNNYWTPVALNSKHPTFTNYYLVQESKPTPTNVKFIVTWKRTYAQIPATRSDEGSLAYTFIGYYGKIANIATAIVFAINGRNRFSETVNCRIQSDYFLIGPQGWCNYAAASSIPSFIEQRYYIPLGTVTETSPGPPATYAFTPTYAAGTANDLAYGTATDNIWDPASFGGIIPTIPSRATYIAAVLAGSEIVAEPSVLSRWRGNIYVRTTKYILPI